MILFHEVKIYTAKKLCEAGYVNGDITYDYAKQTYVQIDSITWDGHTYLDNIRELKVWDRTKKAEYPLLSVVHYHPLIQIRNALC